MAGTDDFTVKIRGKSGHGAFPHTAIDPIVTASQIVLSLQTLVSRNVDPLDSAVVSFYRIHSGTAMNIIPNEAEIAGTIRTLHPATRKIMDERFHEAIASTCATHRSDFSIDFERNAPVAFKDDAQTRLAIRAATAIVGECHVNGNTRPLMGGEDFAYMLEARPGASCLSAMATAHLCITPNTISMMMRWNLA